MVPARPSTPLASVLAHSTKLPPHSSRARTAASTWMHVMKAELQVKFGGDVMEYRT